MTDEPRYAIIYGSDREIWADHVMNGCREHPCCMGKECGMTLAELRQEVSDYYNVVGKWISKSSDSDLETWLGVTHAAPKEDEETDGLLSLG